MALEYAARSEFCLCGDCACERRGVSDSDTRQTLVVVSCVSLLYVLRSMHADALSHVRSRHIRLCRLWRSDLFAFGSERWEDVLKAQRHPPLPTHAGHAQVTAVTRDTDR